MQALVYSPSILWNFCEGWMPNQVLRMANRNEESHGKTREENKKKMCKRTVSWNKKMREGEKNPRNKQPPTTPTAQTLRWVIPKAVRKRRKTESGAVPGQRAHSSQLQRCKEPWRRKWQPTPVLLPGKSPWMQEPGRLQSMGSQRIGHDWATSLSFFKEPWRFGTPFPVSWLIKSWAVVSPPLFLKTDTPLPPPSSNAPCQERCHPPPRTVPRKMHFFLWRFRKFHVDLSIFRPPGCGLSRGKGWWSARKSFLCRLARTTRLDGRRPARCSPEITKATFRRHCHRSGKGAWTIAEQLPFSVAAAAHWAGAPRSVQNSLPSTSLFDSPGNDGPYPPRSAACAPISPRSLSLSEAARVQYGGEGQVHRGYRWRVFGVCGGDRKVDGAGDANGEGAVAWTHRIGTFSGLSRPSIWVNVPGVLSGS